MAKHGKSAGGYFHPPTLQLLSRVELPLALLSVHRIDEWQRASHLPVDILAGFLRCDDAIDDDVAFPVGLDILAVTVLDKGVDAEILTGTVLLQLNRHPDDLIEASLSGLNGIGSEFVLVAAIAVFQHDAVHIFLLFRIPLLQELLVVHLLVGRTDDAKHCFLLVL